MCKCCEIVIVNNMPGKNRPRLSCDSLGYPASVGDAEWDSKHKKRWKAIAGGKWQKRCKKDW